MMMRQEMYIVKEEHFALEASIAVSCGGISIYLCGGDRPHIGTAVLAEPRKSLTGQGWSCTSSVLNFCGHKDEDFARVLAETVCRKFRLPVNVCAGVHIDCATKEQLDEMTDVFLRAQTEILEKIEKMM